MSKLQYKYMEIPEFQAGEKELTKVSDSLNRVRTVMEANIDFILKATDRLNVELTEANQKLDIARGRLTSEEMRDKSTLETTQAVKDATGEVERIQQTLGSISRSGGVAIRQIEEKLYNLRLQKHEVESQKQGCMAFEYHNLLSRPAAKDWKNKVREKEDLINKLQDEIDSLEATLKILIENQNKYGRLLSVDADTAAVANDCLNTAAGAWRKRQSLGDKLRKKYEDKKKELENFKAEMYDLEQAISGLNPEFVSELVFGSGVSQVIWPELFVGINGRNSSSYNLDLQDIKKKIHLNIYKASKE